MNKQNLLQLIADKEGLTIEFKEQFSSGLARDLVAFANAVGGRILLGVADHGEIKGIAQANRVLSQIHSLARECSPSVPVAAKVIPVDKKQCVVIEVRDLPNKPYSCSEGFFVRSGANTQKLKREEIIEFLNREGHLKFESLIEDRFNLRKDFDAAKYRNFLKLADLNAKKINRFALLQNLSLAKTHGNRLRITKAGILFFAAQPERFIPQNEVTCVLYKGIQKVHVLERKDFKLSLPQNVEETVLFFKRHLANEYEIKEIKRREIWDIPLEALREAVLNAVVHRDYGESGASILVEIFDDRVSISNPGGLPGLDPRRFGTVSIRRNPVIADIFHRLGEVEKIGSGINRMRSLCKENGNPEPAFKFDNTFFIAEFAKRGLKKGTKGVENGVEGSRATTQKTTQKITQKTTQKIMALIKEDPGITRKRLADMVGISADGIKFNLNKLKKAGLLKRIGPDKGGHWEVVTE